MNDLPLSEQASQNIERPHYWRNYKDMFISEGVGTEYESALLNLQKNLDATIQADSENPHFKNSFASFSHTLATVRKACQEHGFTIRQFPGKLSGHGPESRRFYTLPICTKITHAESMQWEMVIVDIPVDQKAVSYGAALTFGKRYALQSYFGLASTDSDSMTFIQEKFDLEDAEKTAQPLIEKIEKTETEDELNEWLKKNDAGLKLYSDLVLSHVRRAYANHLEIIKMQNIPTIKESSKKNKAKSPELELEAN